MKFVNDADCIPQDRDYVKLSGNVENDTYTRDLLLKVKKIQKIPKVVKKDTAKEKMVELHAHTYMSQTDGIESVQDLLERASAYEQTAIAILDHDVVQAFPEVMETAPKYGIKPIYGCEVRMVNDGQEHIKVSGQAEFDDTYVVFDIETTGFSNVNDKITEIGAVKISGGEIVDTYSQLINPGIPIPEKIVKLTGIDDVLVSDKPFVAEVLPEFLDFCKGSILVAHNSDFDTGFIRQNAKNQNLPYEFDAIDTLLTVMGGSENIYMSQKNIYFTTGDSGDFDNWDYKPMTTIAKFKLGGGFDFSGSAMISGTPVDQFAFNERNGKFFAAYTVYDYSKTGTQANTENRLAAFDENMKPINEIKNLALGEKIYSARYMGDKAYLVTFKQVDQLFVIDVKDPKNMKTLGYLKVPGYSDYLHPYKDKYLIGFGYDTEENDHGGTVNSGYKVSVFDISDFANPKQVDSKVIGKQGTYSPLSQNHKALMFDYSRDIFAIPMYVTDAITKGKGKEAYEQTYPVFSGVYAFKVSENGLDLKGKITHLT